MSIEYSVGRIVSSELPTTRQLRRLALVGMTAARQYRDLKMRDRRYYAYDEIESLDINELSQELVGVRRGVGVHLDRPVVGFQDRAWRLRFIQSQRTASLSGEGVRMKEAYSFEWNASGVYLAQRALHVIADEALFADCRTGEDDQDRVALWSAENHLETVTREECDHLIAEVNQHYRSIEELHAAGPAQ